MGERKLVKLEVYVVDHWDLGVEGIIDALNDTEDCSVRVVDSNEVTIDWHDEIDINFTDASPNTFRKYFEK